MADIETYLGIWSQAEKILLEASPPLKLLFLCLCIGFALKRTPKIPGWVIPWVLMIAGAVSFHWLLPSDYVVWDSNNPEAYTAIIGAIIGYASTGVHQAVSRLWERIFGGKEAPKTNEMPDSAS